jgi:two-component system chemotaxis response regulator CheB
MIRVLIAEDSITQREIFRRLLNADEDFTVVGEARNGVEVVRMVRECTPDVVLMDIHMPEMDGITATRQIMAEFPVPIVIVSGTLKESDTDLAVQAFKAGAVSVMEKPDGAALLHLREIAPALRRELITASKVNLRMLIVPSAVAAPTLKTKITAAKADVVGICASTGGPMALLQVFAELPRPYPIPILLVQHISRGFETGFAGWLSEAVGQPVAFARHRQHLEPGIWVTTVGTHLTLGCGRRIEVAVGSAADLHCLSGNALFESLAKNAGDKAVGALLTGMGDDGAAGLLSLRNAGGVTILQEESSCLIWGMPKAAQKIGAARYELTPVEIGRSLARLTA